MKKKRKDKKRERLNDYDVFESKRRRAKKRNKGKQDFSDQYEHELYLDNYDY